MNRQQQIVALARQGLERNEIAQRVGCRREYVGVAIRRVEQARVEKAARAMPETATLQARIVALVVQDVGDVEIARRVGCRREYVRVVRQRAGLLRQPDRKKVSTERIEARLESRIGKLKEQLAVVRRQLQGIRKSASVLG